MRKGGREDIDTILEQPPTWIAKLVNHKGTDQSRVCDPLLSYPVSRYRVDKAGVSQYLHWGDIINDNIYHIDVFR